MSFYLWPRIRQVMIILLRQVYFGSTYLCLSEREGADCRNGTREPIFVITKMGNHATAPPSNIYKRLWACLSFGLLMASIFLFLNGDPPTVQIVYSQDRSKHDGLWLSFKTPYHLHAYSAFWDDRRSLGSLPVVRIIAVADILDSLTLYCKLRYQGTSDTSVVMAKFVPIGMGVGLQGHFLREYIITCPLIDEFVPDSVSLIPSPTHNGSFALPITVPARPNAKQDFVVCVSVSYWKHDPYRIVEWMELLRTFGVSKVTIYNNSLTSEASAVFKFYDRLGFVDFRQSHNFVNDSSEYNIHLHMSPVINDCMYRNMHSFKKVVVTDLDEIITPRAHSNYKEMLAAIEKTQPNYHPARNYVFSNAYFFTDLSSKNHKQNKNSKLWTMEYRNRLPASPMGYAIKSMVDPLSCVNMHNHYCWGLTPLYERIGNYVNVDEKFGLNQHYKKCHFDKYEKPGRCAEMFNKSMADDTMLRFKGVLTNRVNAKLKEIGLEEI